MTISDGPCMVSVPDVLNITESAAESALGAEGLTKGTVVHDYSDTVASGLVMAQSPTAGTSVACGSAVGLTISLGQPMVPDVFSQTLADAEFMITTVGLTVATVTQQYTDTMTEGLVMDQTPVSGTLVPWGSTVDLVMSLGPCSGFPNGKWNGTFESENYGPNGIITDWMLGYDYTTNGHWELDIGGGTVISLDPSGDYSYSSYELDFSCSDTATESEFGTTSDYVLTVTGTVGGNAATGTYVIEFTDPCWVDNSGTWEVSREVDADFNNDGGVDFEDFAILASYWRYGACSEPNWCEDSDCDRNCTTDSSDLLIFAYDWLETTGDPTLIGHWTMDDNTDDATVLDSSVNGNHGTAQQNTEYMNTIGIIDGALDFDGTSDYVDLGTSTVIKPSSQLSLACWLYVDELSVAGVINNKIDGQNSGYRLLTADTGVVYYQVGCTGGLITVGSSSVITTGAWHLIVATYDENNGASIYIDGVPAGSAAAAGQILYGTGSSYLGCLLDGSGNPKNLYKGSLDDIKIYDRALAVSEVQTLYNAGYVPDLTAPSPDPMTWATTPYSTGASSIAMVATTASDASGVEYYFYETSANPGGSDSGWQDSSSYEDRGLDPDTTYTYKVQSRDKSSNQNETGWSNPASATTDPTPDSLIAHWAMDDDAANTIVVDSSGNNNNGIAQYNTSILHQTGIIGGALDFDGTSDYVDLGTSTVIKPSSQLSLACWLYVDELSVAGVINNKIDGQNSGYRLLTADTGVVYYQVGCTGGLITVGSSSVITTGAWHLIVATYDENNGASIYIDGVPAGSAAAAGQILYGTGSSYLGCLLDGIGDPKTLYKGSLDDVKIFSKALSASEVIALYNAGGI